MKSLNGGLTYFDLSDCLAVSETTWPRYIKDNHSGCDRLSRNRSYIPTRKLREAKSSQLQVKTNPEALKQVLGWFEQLNQYEVSDTIWLQCKVALAEGFSNVVQHAHQDCSSETAIDIQLNLLPDRLELRIWDSGPGFSLEQALADLPKVIDVDAERGRGLRILNQVADQLSYTSSSNRNCLLVVISLASLQP